MERPRRRRRTGPRSGPLLLLAALLSCLALVGDAAARPAGAAATPAETVSLSGTVYRDLDDDGVRDSGEPGLAGLRVHRTVGDGSHSTVTDADGRWALRDLPAGGAGAVAVETGWLRSQCAERSCPAGPGPDNDVPTRNHFLQLPLDDVTSDRTGVDVGLLPDWPGTSAGSPALRDGEVPANSVDVAARLSWVTSTCSDGRYAICRPGDTYVVSAQLHNQGTTALTGVEAVLALPAGDALATGDGDRDVELHEGATSLGVRSVDVGRLDDGGRLPLELEGTLVPGGLARVTVRLVAGGTVGTPGCVRGAPTSTCPVVEPQGAPLVLGVAEVDQEGDPDSFRPGCDAGEDVRRCPTGLHDKQAEPDEVDPVGHNVDASVGSSTRYDLKVDARLLSTSARGGSAPGETVTWQLSARNTGPAVALRGWQLTLLLPEGSAARVTDSGALRRCTEGTTSAGAPYVRCTGQGPLSPGVASQAMDVVSTVPAGSEPGSRLAVLAYVEPAEDQPEETLPLGLPPLTALVDSDLTLTDNDDGAAVKVL